MVFCKPNGFPVGCTENRNRTDKVPVNPVFTGAFLHFSVEKPVDSVENLCLPNRKNEAFQRVMSTTGYVPHRSIKAAYCAIWGENIVVCICVLDRGNKFGGLVLREGKAGSFAAGRPSAYQQKTRRERS